MRRPAAAGDIGRKRRERNVFSHCLVRPIVDCGGLITEIDRPRSVSVSPNNHASNAYQDSHLWNAECGSINNREALDTSLLPHRRDRHTVTSRGNEDFTITEKALIRPSPS